MKLYVVIEDIDAYPEEGGGVYPDAIFLNRANADKYAERKIKERYFENYNYYIEIWETADEKEGNRE